MKSNTWYTLAGAVTVLVVAGFARFLLGAEDKVQNTNRSGKVQIVEFSDSGERNPASAVEATRPSRTRIAPSNRVMVSALFASILVVVLPPIYH